MLRRIVTKKMLENNPYEKWNQFVDLICMEKYVDLTEIQKVAHLCFWYDAEVQNGGHLQYFLNRGTLLLKETTLALTTLDAHSQVNVLSKAIDILMTEGIAEIENVEDYVDEALEGKFDEVDSEYYSCEPTINDLLMKYLENYEEEFISNEPTV